MIILKLLSTKEFISKTSLKACFCHAGLSGIFLQEGFPASGNDIQVALLMTVLVSKVSLRGVDPSPLSLRGRIDRSNRSSGQATQSQKSEIAALSAYGGSLAMTMYQHLMR